MNEPILTVTGNLTNDPELRFTPAGVAVANFTVAQTPRTKQGDEWVDGETLFMPCTVWRETAEHIAESLTKGTRVVVTGRLTARTFDHKDGSKRTVNELQVDEVGPSLRYATAVVTKAQDGQPQQKQSGGWGGKQQSTRGGWS